jgi:hypothetical protein
MESGFGMVSLLTNHLPVTSTAELTAYSEQFPRRMLRTGKIIGIKIYQAWLIEMGSLQGYLEHALDGENRQCGPQFFYLPVLPFVNTCFLRKQTA